VATDPLVLAGREGENGPRGMAPPDSKLEAVVHQFAAMVRRVGRRYRLSDADLDDLMQEVRIRLWRSEKIGEVTTSYVYRTSMTAAIDILRRRRARGGQQTVALEDVAEPVAADNPSRAAEGTELAEQVARAIDRIAASRRPVVRMYLAGYSCDEVAAMMGWSEAKARNLVYRGLADLRERLADEGISWKTTG